MKKCLLIVVGVLLLCLALPVHAEPVSPKPNQTMPQEPPDFMPVKLPDGTDFQTWEQPFTFNRTYHVAQQHPGASDDNLGTAEAPWHTISKAAQMLQPGERVIVHEGVYREWVKPERGGTGPDKMISYEAAPGEHVVIKGSELWKPKWEKPRHRRPLSVSTWEATIYQELFSRGHAFNLVNSLHKDWPTYRLCRGQMFVDGVRFTQVNKYDELEKHEDAFWVADDGATLHVRFPGDGRPGDRVIELTLRQQVFAPVKRWLNYIRVKGFHMFHSANGIPIPLPQRGLLSASAGHHWIIEDCEIGHANTLGMDIGGGYWGVFKAGELQGHHIIRRNHIHHCGVSAISGWHNLQNTHLLIEDNLITDNCWMRVGRHWESGGVKIHGVEESVIRRNVILRTGMAVPPEDPGHFASAASLWFDGHTYNTRITQNVIAGHGKTPLGMIFMEMSQGPVLVDNNLVVSSGHSGIYEHDTARMVIVQNLSANGRKGAVHLSYGTPSRTQKEINDAGELIHVAHVYEDHHRVYGNILGGFRQYVRFPSRTSWSDWNVLAGLARSSEAAKLVSEGRLSSKEMIQASWKEFHAPFQILGDQGLEKKPKNATFDLAQWRAIGNDVHSIEMPMEITFDAARLELRVKAAPGVELPVFSPVPELPPVAARGADWHYDAGGWLRRHTKYRSYGGWIRRPVPEVAPLEKLLTVDLLGRPRKKGEFQPGPLVNLPVDGTPVRVDPRRTEPRGRTPD